MNLGFARCSAAIDRLLEAMPTEAQFRDLAWELPGGPPGAKPKTTPLSDFVTARTIFTDLILL